MTYLKNLVIHCTATPEGREVSAEEIRRWHTAPLHKGGRGWRQVGYTDMIHLDGTVERLVENNEDGVVDPWEITNGAKGHNSVSRHIVYVGGVAADGKTPQGHPDTGTKESAGSIREGLPPPLSPRPDRRPQRTGGEGLSWLRCQTLAFFK